MRIAHERIADPRPAISSSQLRKNLGWSVEYDPRVETDLKTIDRAMQREILGYEVLGYMDTRVAREEEPAPLRQAFTS